MLSWERLHELYDSAQSTVATECVNCATRPVHIYFPLADDLADHAGKRVPMDDVYKDDPTCELERVYCFGLCKTCSDNYPKLVLVCEPSNTNTTCPRDWTLAVMTKKDFRDDRPHSVHQYSTVCLGVRMVRMFLYRLFGPDYASHMGCLRIWCRQVIAQTNPVTSPIFLNMYILLRREFPTLSRAAFLGCIQAVVNTKQRCLVCQSETHKTCPCNLVRYCSLECQKADRPVHRLSCQNAKQVFPYY